MRRLAWLGGLFKPNESSEWKISLTVERPDGVPEILHVAEISEGAALRRPVAWKGSSVVPATPESWNATFPTMPKFDPEASAAVIVRFQKGLASLGVIVKADSAERTGIAARLRALVQQWIGGQPQKPRPLSDSLIDLREAIKKRVKPLDLQFYYKYNKGQIRAAELLFPAAERLPET
jgi:hypothetical protein